MPIRSTRDLSKLPNINSIISDGLTKERLRIATIIDGALNENEKEKIQFLVQVDDKISNLAELHQDAQNFNFKMMSKERRKHKILEELYQLSKTVIGKLEISQQNIKYYADRYIMMQEIYHIYNIIKVAYIF